MKIELNITFNQRISKKTQKLFQEYLAEWIENGITDSHNFSKFNIGHISMYENDEIFYEYCGE